MNKKRFLITAILPVLLVGCGGGGSSETTGKEQEPISTGVTETFVQFQMNDLKYKEYNYVNGVVPNTKYYMPLSNTDYLLTQNKIYTDMWVDASTKAIAPLSLYFSDAPNVGKTDNLEKIDVSGKQVYGTVYPGFTEYFNYYKGNESQYSDTLAAKLYNQSTMVFPQGSVCYRTLTAVPQKGYITFNSNEVINVSYDEYMAYFEKRIDENLKTLGHTKETESGTWAGYPWKRYKEYDQFGIVSELIFVNFNGQPVIGKAHDFEKYDANQLLSESNNRLNSIVNVNSDEYQNVLLNKNILEKGCDWYNKTAANTILALKKITL